MALIVEDGSVVPNADSYISVADATTYFENHGDPQAWPNAHQDIKEGALRYATTTIDGMFKWTGEVFSLTQPLGWPRSDATDNENRTIPTNAVPERVRYATCELALLHISKPLNENYDRGGDTKLEQVGPVRVEYFSGAAVEPYMPILTRIIGGLGTWRGAMTGDLDRA